MGELKVCLFGKFRVYDAETAVPGLEAKRTQELLSYLLLQPNRPHPRESLATTLWDDQTTTQSKKHLRQSLWQLQSALDSSNHNLLLADAEWLQIDPKADIISDVTLFEQAFSTMRGIPGRNLTQSQYGTLTQVIELYQGDLLEGWYQDWCLFHRERLQNTYLAMLDKLMGFCEAHQTYEDGIYYGSQILGIDSARERTHRRLMRLHYLAGDRTAALRQYQRCVLALDDELGVAPAHSTSQLYEQIKADNLMDVFTTFSYTAQQIPSLPETLLHLKQIQDLLVQFHTHIHYQIQTVESLINHQ